MSSITRTSNSRIKQLADLWPYILLAISLVGLALKLYRGIF
jgi:hypothetical protein